MLLTNMNLWTQMCGANLQIAENLLEEEMMDTTATFTREDPRLPEAASATTTPVAAGQDVTGLREELFLNRRNRMGLENLRQIKLWNNHPLSYHQAVNQLRLHNYQVGPHKKIRDTFLQYSPASSTTGCFTVSEGSTFSAKVSVTDEMPRQVLLSTGKYQAKFKSGFATGFYLPVNMVGALINTIKQVYNEIASGSIFSEKKLRLSINQSRVIIRWRSAGERYLEIYYSVPSDVRLSMPSTPGTGSAVATNMPANGCNSNSTGFTSKYHLGRDALLRIAKSEVNTFIDSLKNVEDFITHLNKVLEQRQSVLT